MQKVSVETFRDTFQDQNTEEDLYNYLEKAYNTEQLTSELLNQQSEFYFVFNGNDLAGYLKININEAQSETNGEEALEIERIYVLPEFKGKGLGKILIQQAVERAQFHQKTNIWLGVWEHNQAALAFYKKLGFVQTGAHSFFMGEDEQTDLILTKKLTKE
ncbi:GNAT family N-acetyltransferase [Desemzia sp. C1]|uniref:GNAT family N-acetyltransferase n=1 Tax=Desemzia sp. C1 TaxID=2892016 RepID=UPI0024159038|nr:GNAT family N-acetyltransferase [Desemzia sp. C1]